jgi:hypothetical protein
MTLMLSLNARDKSKKFSNSNQGLILTGVRKVLPPKSEFSDPLLKITHFGWISMTI